MLPVIPVEEVADLFDAGPTRVLLDQASARLDHLFLGDRLVVPEGPVDAGQDVLGRFQADANADHAFDTRLCEFLDSIGLDSLSTI